MSVIVILFVILALSGNGPVAWGSDQHMICKTVQSVSDGEGPAQSNLIPQTLQGRPGKRGVKGERGVPGLKGQNGLPGIVDKQLVKDIIREEVATETISLCDEMGRLKRQITEQETEIACLANHGIRIETKCYFAVIHERTDVRSSDGDRLCADSGGKPADILNVDHQNAVENCIRGLIPSSRTSIYLWTAMTYKNRQLRSPSGASRSLRWQSSYPSSSLTDTGVKMNVVREAALSNNGLYNWQAPSMACGFICEI